MDDMDENKIPEKCPNCKKKKINMLQHIRWMDECRSKVGPELLSKWRKLAYKIKKRKYQKKYVKAGKHKVHQANYRKKCIEEDRESVLKIQRQKAAKFRNKLLFSTKKRFKSFDLLCRNILHYLKKGKCPMEKDLNKFHLVEDKVCKEYVEKEFLSRTSVSMGKKSQSCSSFLCHHFPENCFGTKNDLG